MRRGMSRGGGDEWGGGEEGAACQSRNGSVIYISRGKPAC